MPPRAEPNLVRHLAGRLVAAIHRMPLRHRFLIAPSIGIFFILVASPLAYIRFEAQQSFFEQELARKLSVAKRADEAFDNLATIDKALQFLLLTSVSADDEERLYVEGKPLLLAARARIGELARMGDGNLLDDQETEVLRQALADLNGYHATIIEVLDRGTVQWREAAKGLKAASARFEAAERWMTILVDRIDADLDGEVMRHRERSSQAWKSFGATVLGVVALMLAISLKLAGYLSADLGRIVQRLGGVVRGGPALGGRSETAVLDDTLEAVIALQQRLTDAIESIPAAFFLWDAEDRLILANRVSRRYFAGLEDCLETGTPFAKLIRAAVERGILATNGPAEDWIAKRIRGRRQLAGIVPQQMSDGRSLLLHQSRTAEGGIVSIAADISEEQRLLQALRDSEERFRLAVAGSNAAIWDWNLTTGSIHVSSQINRFLRVKDGAVPITTASWPMLVVPAFREVFHRALIDHLRGVTAAFDLEYAIQAEDGPPVWVHHRGQALRGTDGRVHRMAGSITDVTDRRNAEDALRHAQKLDALGRLAGGLAHEFNNLLSIIDGYTSLAGARLGEGNPVTVELDQVLQASRRGAQLTKDLLAASRKPGGRRLVVDLNGVIRRQLTMLGPLLGELVEVAPRLTEQPIPVEADEGMLGQAIMNLAVNARDAMPEGGRLTVSAAMRGEQALIEVSDTGIGMDQATRDRLFEPFFTTKPVGKGTGLGLLLVHSVVKEMGGRVEVESEAGKGTLFRLTLPVSARPLDVLPVPAEPGGGFRKGTLLVAEDEGALRDLLVRTLEEAGHIVLAAANGNHALVLQDDDDLVIDLLLTDVVMPELDGIRLAKLMRAVRPDIRVIFMTGYADRMMDGASAAVEGEVVLAKPLQLDALLGEVQRALAMTEG